MTMMTRRRFMLTSGSTLAMVGWAGQRAFAELCPPEALHDLMAEQVATGAFPGAVWLLAYGDDVNVETLGVTSIDGRAPMRRGTIFRIASMSKAVTATAVMMLVEEGKLSLDAPVERWLPELADRRVLRRIDGPIDDTVPAVRPITVRDLLDFTFGFGVLFDPTLPIMQATEALELANGEPVPMTPHDPDEWIRRLGTLPLISQPGERWMYNTGSLVQSVLVRRAAQQDFDAFLRERIFEPLGMVDTDFFVPPEKLHRFAGCGYFTDPATGEKSRMDADGAASAYARRPIFPSGAAGLVSTVDDYLCFARMLLNGGRHRRERLLSKRSVRLMTTDQLKPEQKDPSVFFPEDFFETHGWSLGVGVITAPDAVSSVPGRYGWEGGFGTSWFNDPAQDFVGIVMTQSADFLFSGALEQFWQTVYTSKRR